MLTVLFKLTLSPLLIGLSFYIFWPINSFAKDTKTIDELRQTIIKKATILPSQFPEFKLTEIELGWLLFYDSILSGNKQVSCASCHHPKTGTSDGLSLGLGDGSKGIGIDRHTLKNNLPEQRIPRNSPSLFNLGDPQFLSLFHDGRLEKDVSRKSGIRTPLEDEMTVGFDSLLSAQAMFPVLSPDEMAGHYSENDVALKVRKGMLTGDGGAWDIIAKRVENISQYRKAFDNVIGEKPIHFTDIANAIAAFITFEWRATDSPFDDFIENAKPFNHKAMQGLKLFYGKANCSGCHSGLYQSDQKFHAIAMVQVGPGKTERFEDHHRDEGRMRVTGNLKDIYKFRTPSLRNVELTAPYGHAGSYATLEAVIKHHLDPVKSLYAYQPKNLAFPKLDNISDFAILNDKDELNKIAKANELEPSTLNDIEIEALIEFLKTLTDPIRKAGRLGIPKFVPSGLPIE